MIWQTRARLFRGITDLPGKIVSVFEPRAEIIRKGKANKPTQFGKLVKIQKSENQIITHYAVYRQRPADATVAAGSARNRRTTAATGTGVASGRCRFLLGEE